MAGAIQLVARVGLSLGASTALLIGSEMAARVIDPYGGTVGFVRYHATRERELAPGFRGRYYGQDVYINEFGFRDREGRPAAGPVRRPGTSLAMAFGDSFTFGAEIGFADTYPYLTELRLAEIHPEEHWEVINAGVPGYAPFQELHYIREIVDVFRPDVVVLQYTLNDAFRPSPEAGLSAVLRPLLNWLRDHSYAYHVVRNSITAVTTSPPPPSGPDEHPLAAWYRQLYRPDSPDWAATVEQLRGIDAFLAERSIPLIVLVYGDLERPPSAARSPEASFREVYPFEALHRQIADVFRPAWAVILDALDVLGPLPHKDVYELAPGSTRHPGRVANTRVAAALARCIASIRGGPADAVRLTGRCAG